MPNFLSSDNDPLYRFYQWQANLRILDVTDIKSVPYAPLSHPFVERLIGTVRREYLDHILFWTTADLENKLLDFRTYFNNHRAHDSLEGRTPDTSVSRPLAKLRSIRWQPPLSRPVPDAGGRLIYQRPALAGVFGQPRQSSKESLFPNRNDFPDPIVSLLPGAFRK